MAEKINLNDFLSEMVKLVNTRLDSFESDVMLLRSEMENIKLDQQQHSVDDLKDKIKSIEATISTTKELNMVDRSILKMLESEENARRD